MPGKYIKPVLSALFLIVIFWSCCPNDELPPPKAPAINPDDYLVTKIGASWIYSDTSYNVDNARIDSLTFIDSVVIIQNSPFYGKNAFWYQRFTKKLRNDPPLKTDTVYRYQDGLKFYEWVPYLDFQALRFSINRWFLYVDFENIRWQIWDTTVTNVPVSFMGVQVFFTGKVAVTGERSTDSTIQIKTPYGSYDTQSYKFFQITEGNGTVSGLLPVPVPVTITYKIHIWFGKKSGIINKFDEPVVVKTSLSNEPIVIRGKRDYQLLEFKNQ